MIETERLTLRIPIAADLEPIAKMWADPDTVKFIGKVPMTREQSWQRLQRYVGHWALHGYGSFALIERASGRYVGEVGIANFEREITPPIGPFEAGWVLSPTVHGRGYASEALRGALAFHDEKFPGVPVRCIIDTANAPSLKVAAKAGFVEATRATYHNDVVIVLERNR
jgi:RimJ/RimL family protein N-acetyltransferase